MYKGQHLYIQKGSGSYTHHGLGLGNGRVIHYSGLANDLVSPGVIEVISLDEFANGHEIRVKAHLSRKYKPEESIIRASLRLGEAQYHILHNNCEHFVEWCITGLHHSSQSRRGKFLYSAGIGARALLAAKNPAGFVAGAAVGYVYIHRQGLKKIPNLQELENQYIRLMQAKHAVIELPYNE